MPCYTAEPDSCRFAVMRLRYNLACMPSVWAVRPVLILVVRTRARTCTCRSKSFIDKAPQHIGFNGLFLVLPLHTCMDAWRPSPKISAIRDAAAGAECSSRCALQIRDASTFPYSAVGQLLGQIGNTNTCAPQLRECRGARMRGKDKQAQGRSHGERGRCQFVHG